jgi:DNA polymerase III delta prime subunit
MHTGQTQWLQKYHPQKVGDVVGNTRVIRSLKEWLSSIQKYKKKTHSVDERPVPIVFLYGPGGIGKTSIAQVVLKHYNYNVYELNSGEVRSKKRMQDILDKVLNNHSVNMMKKKDSRQTMSIIMDEIDGMSCGDKGGLHELFHIMEKQPNCVHPIICIGNRPYEKKIPTTLYTEYQLRYPSENDIQQRLRHICKQEDVKIDDVCLLWIIKFGNLDVRRTIHFLQEVVYQCGKTVGTEITIEDIEHVKNTSYPTKLDCNMFTITRTTYAKKQSLHDLYEMYNYDEPQITMMMYENLPTQLGQKNISHSDNVRIHMHVLHNWCHLDVLDNEPACEMGGAKSAICCGFANHEVSNLKTVSSTPKKIQYTNILTKIANYSNIRATFNDVSYQLRFNTCFMHYVIPIMMKDITEHPEHITQYGVTLLQLEKLIQVYNKWVGEVRKSESPKITKILARIKKEWKTHLKAQAIR